MEVVVLHSIFLGVLLSISTLFLVRRYKIARAKAQRNSPKVVEFSNYQIKRTGKSFKKGSL